MKNDKNLKKPVANFPDSDQISSTPIAPSSRSNFKKIIILFFILCFIIIVVTFAVLLLGDKILKKSVGGFQWCKNGNTFKVKDTTLTAVGVENYQSNKFEGKVCHMIFAQTDLQTDYYFDEEALTKLKGSKDKEVGNGCIVYQIKNIKEKTELCFGVKVKSYKDEETKKEEEESELFNSFKEIFEGATISISTPSSQTIVTPEIKKTGSFAGTKWHYQIDVGGGVGGVIRIEDDNENTFSGTYEENGPEGKKEKKFTARWESGVILLSMEDFPQITVTLSVDGKTMVGKPTQLSPDIFYPEDFFKATLEQ